MHDDPVIAEWAASPVVTRQTAARLARDLAVASRHDRVDSIRRIAAKFCVCVSVATNARNLLMGQGMIYKSGRHYYVS
jgi:hypothetical protein